MSIAQAAVDIDRGLVSDIDWIQETRIGNQTITDNNSSEFRIIVPVMLADATYGGKWRVPISEPQPEKLFNGFKNKEGQSNMVFLVDLKKNNTKVQVMFEDDDFIDGKKAWIQFNLTNTAKRFWSNSVFYLPLTQNGTGTDYRIFHGESLMVEDVTDSLIGSLTMTLTSAKNLSSYNLEVNDTSDLQIDLKINIATLGLHLSSTMVYQPPKSMAYISDIAIIVVCSLLIMLSLFVSTRIDRMDIHIPSLDNMGCYSMVIVAALYFQYFGFFVMLALQNYTDRSSWAIGIICFTLVLYTTCSYKIGFVIFLHKYHNHPQIHLNNFKSPKGRFLLGSMFTIMTTYILTVLFIRHYGYTPMLLIYSSFPLIKVIESSFSPSKSCFSVNIHILTWFPCLLFGMVIRGFNNSLVQLRPFPGFTGIISSMFVAGLILTYLQSKLGTRFFLPRACSPGIHQLLVDRTRLADEILDSDCVICLHTLRLTPDEVSLIDSTNDTPLAGDVPIMKARCGHHFHADCLTNWLTIKKDCPTCRENVKVF